MSGFSLRLFSFREVQLAKWRCMVSKPKLMCVSKNPVFQGQFTKSSPSLKAKLIVEHSHRTHHQPNIDRWCDITEAST
jgi:hypothetical protein